MKDHPTKTGLGRVVPRIEQTKHNKIPFPKRERGKMPMDHATMDDFGLRTALPGKYRRGKILVLLEGIETKINSRLQPVNDQNRLVRLNDVEYVAGNEIS